MSYVSGLDKPRSPMYHRFWSIFFIVAVLAGCFGIYIATQYVDYTWRWNRVPQYFFYEHNDELRSEIEGEVHEITPTEKREQTRIVVTGNGEEESYLLKGDNVHVDKGDYVYPGDVLGSCKEWKVGLFLSGLWLTLKISAISIIIGMIVGVLTGLARISDNPALRWTAITYIELVRGSPLLVQLMIWYYVVGTLINQILTHNGLGVIPTFWYGCLGLAIFTGAYTAEIVRAGIQSVHTGQMEAARSLGLTYTQSMAKVIMPQAIRRILPALAGQFISLIKDSSLLGVIAIRELTKVTREVVTASLQTYEMWIVCAILYLVMTFTLSLFVQYLERKAVNI